MKILLVTPYFPYPPEKTGGVHTICNLIKTMESHTIDIFYYGENRVEEYVFTKMIDSIYYEDLRKKERQLRLKSIIAGKTYTAYRYNMESDMLKRIIDSQKYDLVIFDQYSSMQIGLISNINQMLFMHDSMPLLFERKSDNGNFINRVYYNLQRRFAIREERSYYKRFKKIIFVSDRDIEEEKKLHTEFEDKYALCDLGINIDEVKQAQKHELPNNSIVFTGVMDYEPNTDAMLFFVNNVFDQIVDKIPDAHLYIVGKNPTKEILEFDKRENITVTGMVDSVFSYIKGATVYISPLRIGSGKKNKIIEAIACNTPIIASNVSMDGFDDTVRGCVKIANRADDWAKITVSTILDKRAQDKMKKLMNGVIDESYQWGKIANSLLSPFQ